MSNKVYGLYRASVLNNADPIEAFRLQVLAPDLSDAPLPWAIACATSQSFAVPNIGDTVWVMFEAGDIEHPVWVGVLPGHAD